MSTWSFGSSGQPPRQVQLGRLRWPQRPNACRYTILVGGPGYSQLSCNFTYKPIIACRGLKSGS